MSDELLTLPEIAKRCGVSERRADYAVRVCDVAPTVRVGIIRVYDADGVARIKDALNQIGRKRREAARA
jgi:hypothetical protein